MLVKTGCLSAIKTTFVDQLGRKTVAKSDGGSGSSIANGFVVTKSHSAAVIRPNAPSRVTSLGCSPVMLAMTVPCQVPQPAQGQPYSLQSLLQAPAHVRENKTISSASSRLGLYRDRSNAEQQRSFCTAFPVFLPLGKQGDIAKDQALYICAVVHTPFTILWDCRGLEWPVALQGITQILQSCSWELMSPAGPSLTLCRARWMPLQLVSLSPVPSVNAIIWTHHYPG